MSAITGPAQIHEAPRAGRRATNSLIAQASIDGAGTPPTSSASPMRHHSPCCHARTDFLNDSGKRDRVRVGVERRRVAVGVGERFGQRALGQPRGLVEHLAHRCRRRGRRTRRWPSAFSSVEHLEQVELQVAHVALVVAHACAFRYGLTVGLWPTDARAWWAAVGSARSRCRFRGVPRHTGTPFIVGTGTTGHHRRRAVIAVLVERFGAGGRSGESAAALKATASDLHRCERAAMAVPLSSALRSAYGPKVRLSWDLAIMA